MGPKAFSTYDAHTDNCQRFVSSVLQANNLMTDELNEFINQDADAVFQRMPSITERLAKFATDTAAVADRVIHGEGDLKP
eukprot:35301-Eustigmatos_ZCMA.PRE.1